MYGIKFNIDYEDISFEGFSLTNEVYLDFSGSGVIFFEDFDNLLKKAELLDKDEFADIIMEEYLTDFNNYEDTINLNQEDLDYAYKEYVKEYKNLE
jgi:hypothetical protein